MKLSVSRFAVLFCTLAVVLVSAFASLASADDAIMNVKRLRWKEVGSIVYTDTTFITDESDTIRTEPIDTSDWDWDMIAHSQLTGGASAARVFFVSSTATNNGVTDSLNYTVEIGTGRDTLYAYAAGVPALTTAHAFGNFALAAGGIIGGGANSNVWSGPLVADPDGATAPNIWLAPSFRLRVAGDLSGSSPKVSGVKCYVVYPQRAASK